MVMMLLAGCGGSDENPSRQLRGFSMGTSYTITIVDKTLITPESISAALETIENTMSTYRPESELMNLNAAPPKTWVRVSAPLYEVLMISQAVSKMSAGAFDITAAPLVNLWGFGPDSTDAGTIPSEGEITQAKSTVGYENLLLTENYSVYKMRDLEIDLSAVAKGYAVDRIAELLDAQGINNYLVEIGGELKGKGRNARGEPWHIAIETPQSANIAPQNHRIIDIDNISVASSGDYRNFFEVAGRKYSHTIDPRTGRPINNGLLSVTVLSETTALADALATAFNVLGLELAMQLANENNIPAYFLEDNNSGLRASHSTAFIPYIGDNQ
tara:strand:+ start:331 stop:1317 length:987 start_codon:yes stop_codon:yes gene_type:complete